MNIQKRFNKTKTKSFFLDNIKKVDSHLNILKIHKHISTVNVTSKRHTSIHHNYVTKSYETRCVRISLLHEQ